MVDPFETALGVLLGAAGSVAAIYRAGGETGTPIPIRVIHGQASNLAHLSMGAAVLDGDLFSIALKDAPDLAKGDHLLIGNDTFVITAAPLMDDEGISWKAQGAPL